VAFGRFSRFYGFDRHLAGCIALRIQSAILSYRRNCSLSAYMVRVAGLAAEVISLVSCLVFACVILIWGGMRLVALTHELNQTSAALGVRISYVYSIIPISGCLWVLYGLYYLFDIIRFGKIRIPTEVSEDKTTPGQAKPVGVTKKSSETKGEG